MKRQKNQKRQAQGRPMRSERPVVNLRISDIFGSIAEFCEKIKTERPNEKAEDIYMDIFCRGILDYESEKTQNEGKGA